MVNIEKGIPMGIRPAKKMKYPWLDMAVGDSFVFESGYSAAIVNARQASERYGKKFSAGEHGGKIRIWRIK